jgi:hypothetical protein
MLEREPHLGPVDVRERLAATAVKTSGRAPGWDADDGFGVIDVAALLAVVS